MALDPDLAEARGAVEPEARVVGGEDAAGELVVAGRFGFVGERVHEPQADALPAGGRADVDGVLADARIRLADAVGRDAREAEDRALVVGRDQERAALLEPARDLVRPARARLERGLALGDPVVVDRR